MVNFELREAVLSEKEKKELETAMALCSDSEWDAEAGQAIGEPTECALVVRLAEKSRTAESR